MVRKTTNISDEFQGGLLPGLNQAQGHTQPVTTHASAPATQGRRKISPYVDDPYHVDLIDDLLTALRPYGVRRDVSQLMRALLNQAAAALDDPNRLDALAAECLRTPPER